MKVFVGHRGDVVECPPKRDALVLLNFERKRCGEYLSRIEMTQEEASSLMMDLEPHEFSGWMQFSTVLGIPFTIVKAEAACYSI